MYKIGLTGGICSGKSFVLQILKELGCYTIRADEIAKNILFSSKSTVIDDIVKVFGESILDEKEGINKEAFTRILFEDDEKRNYVNKIVHPMVKTEREAIIKSLEESEVYDLFVYESALLVESGIYKDFDKIIIVYTSQEQQIKRLMARDNLAQAEAEKRIKAQFPLSEKLKVANYAIDTTGSLELSRAKTLEAFHLIKKDLKIQ